MSSDKPLTVIDEPQARPTIYASIDATKELRQGEIISGVTQYVLDPVAMGVTEVVHSFVVVASQDCDLLWDFDKISSNAPGDLNEILLYEAHATAIVRTQVAGADVWKRVIQNKDERYHSLEASPSECDQQLEGLPDLVVDFKRLFSMQPLELYRQCKEEGMARRRCRLEMPYREHFQGRASFYLQRVTLPDPHRLQPVKTAKA